MSADRGRLVRRARAGWSRAATAVDSLGQRLVAEPWASGAYLVLAVVAFGYALAIVAVRLWYEALGVYNVDTPIYWAIGHGILKGYAPYRDLWDIKPPGIFLLSAFSFLVAGDGKLTHATQILSLVLVALSPLVYALRLERERRKLLLAAPIFIALWALVLMLTAFVADTAFEVQTETHAMPGIVGFTLLVGVPGRWAFRGRALGILVAMGMKEPFLLVVPAVYLIMDPETREPWADFWGPVLLAAAAGALALLVLGWLPAFLGLYLRSMFGSHIGALGSPLGRTFGAFDLIWDKLRKYSLFLPMAVTYCTAIFVMSSSKPDDLATRQSTARRFQIVLIGVLLTSLAVGLSGYFYDHHFALIAPLCLAVIFALMSRVVRSLDVRSWLRAGLVPLVLLAVVFPDWVPLKSFRDRAHAIDLVDAPARESAKVIDAVLDRLKIDRYLWIGPGGFPPYSYTRHVPLGPLFFQQVIFFDGHYPRWLTTKFRKELTEAKIIVFNMHIAGPMDDEVRATMARDFEPLPARFIPPGLKCQYPILIRKGFPVP